MAYGLSNGHMTDDVTWPWKVKLITPIRLKRHIVRRMVGGSSRCRCMTWCFAYRRRAINHVTVDLANVPNVQSVMLLSIETKRLGSIFHIPRDQVMWYDVFGWSEGRRMVGQSDDRTAYPGCCFGPSLHDPCTDLLFANRIKCVYMTSSGRALRSVASMCACRYILVCDIWETIWNYLNL